MRTKIIIILLIITTNLFSQSRKDTLITKYSRSSLYMLMIDDSTIDHAASIKSAYLSAPIPDKFNDHNLKSRSIPSKSIVKNQQIIIDNFLEQNEVAKRMVAKWFNRNEKGEFNVDLIAERGFYNASEMDKGVANASKRGNALLADAGEELIGNSFVLVSDFEFIPDSVFAARAKKIATDVQDATKGMGAFGSIVGGLAQATQSAADVYKESKGYVVVATSYLYRLNWNDSIAGVFYQEYWTDSTSFSPERKAAFDSSKIFSLTFIGKNDANKLVPVFGSSQPSDSLIAGATINSVDAVISKLQKKHQEFRTKTPLISVEPLAAQIGLKESLEAGDKYEVLEKNINPETGRTFYKKMGTISVDGSQIWDNRFMPDEKAPTGVDRTLFKGGSSKYYPGMLIKQKN